MSCSPCRSVTKVNDHDPPDHRLPVRSRSRARRYGRAGGILAVVPVALALAACGSSSSSSSSSSTSAAKSASGQVPLSASRRSFGRYRVVPLTPLDQKGWRAQMRSPIREAYPEITMQVVPLSEDADTARATIDRDFLAGKLDPRRDRRQHRLDRRNGERRVHRADEQLGAERLPSRGRRLDQLQWKTVRALWYYNAEGLYYRKDLIKTVPKTPAQLIADAEAALKADPKLKEGIAIRGEQV